MPVKGRTRNTQSEIARAAAAKARVLRLAAGPPDVVDSSIPSLFVVRDGSAAACRWEVRRFGGIVLSRSEALYTDAALARQDGEDALARWMSGQDQIDLVPDRPPKPLSRRVRTRTHR